MQLNNLIEKPSLSIESSLQDRINLEFSTKRKKKRVEKRKMRFHTWWNCWFCFEIAWLYINLLEVCTREWHFYPLNCSNCHFPNQQFDRKILFHICNIQMIRQNDDFFQATAATLAKILRQWAPMEKNDAYFYKNSLSIKYKKKPFSPLVNARLVIANVEVTQFFSHSGAVSTLDTPAN